VKYKYSRICCCFRKPFQNGEHLFLTSELRFELKLSGSALNETRYQSLHPSPLDSPAQQRSHGIQEAIANSPLSNRANDQGALKRGWFFYLAEIAEKRITHNVIIRQGSKPSEFPPETK
jgi:hypothetical protein